MQAEDYKYMYELEDHFWWFAGMRTIAGALLDQYCSANCNRRILDAGCGTGSNLLWLRIHVAPSTAGNAACAHRAGEDGIHGLPLRARDALHGRDLSAADRRMRRDSCGGMVLHTPV